MTPVEKVDAAFERIASADRPEVWITLRDREKVLAEAAAIDTQLPLAGLVFAVKDNIDVAGLPTTAAAPSYAYVPQKDASAVARLRAAGAVVVGKTNLDQFATGLVGTRSPYGAVRNAWDPSRISGGSSSGSAVAVALGMVDFALGTDTAGSGRVPAALNGIVGVKPTRGLVPVTGVVPACYTLDCVSVFARNLTLARVVTEQIEGPDGSPLCRDDFERRAAPARPRIAVPIADQLGGLADGWREAFAVAVARFAALGAEIVETDISALLEAAALLYDGAFVAERYAAVGKHLEKHSRSHRHRPGSGGIGDHPGSQGQNGRRLGIRHRQARRARSRGPHRAERMYRAADADHRLASHSGRRCGGPCRCEQPHGQVHQLRESP